jgi:two-component sensor histidine kinase
MRVKNQVYLLECGDTGQGIKPEELRTFSSLGLRLIHNTVDQLNGKMVWKNDEGTVCLVCFAEE